MNKRILIITLIIICILPIIGCNFGKGDSSAESADHGSYDFYQITDGSSLFDVVIKQNRIDQDYEVAFYSDANSTEDFVRIQTEYLTLWQKECVYAVSEYARCLPAAEKDAFLNVQAQWEKSFEANFSFENRVLQNTDALILPGSSFQYLFLSEQREAVRARTIRIKYLHFLLEQAKTQSTDAKDYESLKFLYA